MSGSEEGYLAEYLRFQFIPPTKKVRENLYPAFTQPSDFADVTLVVEGKRLYTSKYVLSHLSPVFRTMFTAEFKEKNSNEVELPGKVYQDMLDFLLFTQPSSTVMLTGELAIRLYPLCHEYEMIPEKQRCINAIQSDLKGNISSDLHRTCIQLACTYELPEVYKACVDVAIDNPKTHYDALIHNMNKTPANLQTILVTKLKRPVFDYRYERKFMKRSERAMSETTYYYR